ncbi:MAG: arginine--tRNA ligase [Gammaproteobacteria bacterium]|nr:arginine--tRNA ligase [Gammaproteobacteria bacterium]MCW8839999.1 arginine--tRNA ligase [Gammaproteobacteria bacterium]MCW8927971.1 arginine--tRNA ligase [Gammaproteobacteria bacterium]MCW8958256.1 arginine--tRNA ligase [Gammaproteobacteria bacterium]MCW8972186.1 arginine--tRNA ligase [Gammaproteobacteria bacterium]
MKHHLQELVQSALHDLTSSGVLECALPESITIERTRDKSHGDFACNIAMVLAKPARSKPRELAEKIVAHLPESEHVAKVAIAGPGFINLTMAESAYHAVVREVHESGEAYGRSTIGAGKRVQVEFVSANPTGPLHVGHGRGAAYGATVADLLAAAGFEVHREYYVNDAGRQMDILGTSVWLRYLELAGETLTFPANGYKGDYVWDIAATLHREHGDAFRHPAADVYHGIPADEPAGGDKEAHIDALIMRAKQLLGTEDYRKVFDRGLDTILGDIRQDLEEFGVVYEQWYSERELVESGKVDAAIEQLKKSDHIYEEKGALWFRSTDFGDEKDRVVVRDNGVKTYFASDIGYHWHKLDRGFDRVIDVWGADHHGYVPRVKAALTAMGDKEDADKLDVLLVQFAILYRGGERLQMSTRSGSFVTLRELREEVGNDAARFFYVMRKCEQHMDFDLDLAKSQSNDNPLFYIQYAHARVCSVLRQMEEKGLSHDNGAGLKNIALLNETHEQELMRTLSRYPEIVEGAALSHEPHQLAHYLRELANDFHTYYNAHQFLVDESGVRDARLTLITATRQVIANGLGLLGVSAPESM